MELKKYSSYSFRIIEYLTLFTWNYSLSITNLEIKSPICKYLICNSLNIGSIGGISINNIIINSIIY